MRRGELGRGLARSGAKGSNTEVGCEQRAGAVELGEDVAMQTVSLGGEDGKEGNSTSEPGETGRPHWKTSSSVRGLLVLGLAAP